MSDEEHDSETSAYIQYVVWCESCDDNTFTEYDPAGMTVECEWCDAKIWVIETK